MYTVHAVILFNYQAMVKGSIMMTDIEIIEISILKWKLELIFVSDGSVPLQSLKY